MEQVVLHSTPLSELKKIIGDVLDEKLNTLHNKEENNQKYLTRKEAADILKISAPTLSEYVKEGKIKAYRMGGRLLFAETDVANALKEIPTIKYKRG